MDAIIPLEVIKGKIYLIRGQKVLLDKDLAGLYGVTTSNLNKAVKRNFDRFPGDFMFQLADAEAASLRFQIGMSKITVQGMAGGERLRRPEIRPCCDYMKWRRRCPIP